VGCLWGERWHVVMLGRRLDLMILEVFSNLNDSTIRLLGRVWRGLGSPMSAPDAGWASSKGIFIAPRHC